MKELGGRASSLELISKLLEKGMDVVTARLSIADAVRSGEVKKVPNYEKEIEEFVLPK